MLDRPSVPHRLVWIIDDDETALLLAEGVLRAAQFTVRTFTNAPSALEAARAEWPDIFVVDLIMPELDGFELCARLRRLPRGQLTPILVTTALDDPVSIDRAYLAGATDFAAKPLNWAIEVHRLHYLLRAADVARELQAKEQEARLAREDWERTFDSITDSVTVLDTDLRIVRANAATARLFATPPEGLLGRPAHEVFYGAVRPRLDCPAVRALLTKLPTSVIELDCGPTGRIFEVAASPVTDAQGRVTRLVHVVRDVTEQKKLEAGLRQAQKMEALGTLAGGVAHDFNNLLTVVQCYADLLLVQARMAGNANPEAQAIVAATKRGAALTRQLLIFSRKEGAGTARIPLNLNDSVESVQKMLARVLPKTVTLHTRLEPELCLVAADPNQIDQVLVNLAVNSEQAMPSGGALTIETQNAVLAPDAARFHPEAKPGDYVRLTVSDTGQGMDRQTQERMYEPFFTTKRATQGTGLGLAVVFGIVRDHGGFILCQSEVGRGTTFRIYFPVPPPTGPEPEPAEAPALPMRGGSETILIVEDEPPLRRVLESHLAKLGYRVYAVGDGESALRTYSETRERPGAVILNLGTPKMSGWECLAKLRELDPQARVLVVTGYAADETQGRALDEGAAGFLRKPFNLTDISGKLREILDASHPAG